MNKRTNENINKDLYREIPVEEEDAGMPLMDKPFNPSLINIDVKSPTISILMDRLSQTPAEIDLYTDFQRKDDLWDKEKQSRLIESILIKLPLPAFYFDGTNDNRWLVVDGLQRLSALRNFIIQKSLTLSGLEFLKDLEGLNYDSLPRSLKRTIDTTQITAHIINPGTPPEVKFNIFKRINTGGLVLAPQEIRHALNQGAPAKFVKDLAEIDEFKTATENRIDTSRMLDREFVTRFAAFYIIGPENYAPDFDSFLNSAMVEIGKLSDEGREKIAENFKKAMRAAYIIFEEWAFRKADRYPERRKPISKALFEVWSVGLAKISDAERLRLLKKRESVIDAFVELCKNDKEFWDSITSSTSEKSRVIIRFKRISGLISEVAK
jgi:hypothetical protein